MNNEQRRMDRRMNMKNGYGEDLGERGSIYICTEYRTGVMTGAWADDPDKAHLTRTIPQDVSTGCFHRRISTDACTK